MKICSKCKVEKELTEFYKSSVCKDGYRVYCKSCIKLYNSSDKGVAAHKKHIKTDKYKVRTEVYRKTAARKLSLSKYAKSEKGRIKQAGLRQTEEHKKYHALYAKTDKFKSKQQVYNKTDGVKERRKRRNHSPSKNSNYVTLLPPSDNPLMLDGLVHVSCKKCKTLFAPTNSQITNRLTAFTKRVSKESNFYCSDECKNSCEVFGFLPGVQIDPRSKIAANKSEKVQARKCQTPHLKQVQCDQYNGQSHCESCGDFIDIELHHTQQVSTTGLKAINTSGHILLCAGCHTKLHANCA